jgi:ABC-type transport system substrate-binding protein
MPTSLKYFFGAIEKYFSKFIIRLIRLPRFIRPIERKFIAISSIVIIVFSFAAVLDRGGSKPAYGGTYTQGFIGEPKYINPILAVTDIDLSLSKFIYSGLVRIDEAGNPAPDIASAWQFGSDGKSVTFTIKPNIYWHDNTNFTASDVAYTYNLIKDQSIQSPLYAYWKDVQVQVIDESTVTFVLKDYSPNFLWETAIGIVPEHVGRSNFNKSFIGTGPYKYSKVKVKNNKIESIILTRNARWYNEQPPYIDSVEIWLYQDRASALNALKSQKIHAIDGNGVSEDWLNTYSLNLHQQSALFLNSQSDLFNDVKKRDNFINGVEPINAREINVIVDNVSTLDQKFIDFKSNWQTRGAVFNITIDSVDVIQKNLLSKRAYDIIVVPVDSSSYADRYPYWHSSQADAAGLNFSRYKSNDLDKLLNDQHKSIIPSEQKVLALQIDKIVAEQQLVIPLSTKTVVYDIAKNIHISEVADGVSAANRFDNFNLWYIKTKR